MHFTIAVTVRIICCLSSLLQEVASLQLLPHHRQCHQYKRRAIISMQGRMREEEVRNTIKEARETYSGVYKDGEVITFADEQLVSSLKSKRSYLSILVERLVQSFDDAQVGDRMKKGAAEAVHSRRRKATATGRETVATPVGGAATETVEKDTRERIVLLGSGWGAHAFLKTIDAERYAVTAVSPRNYFLFTPMLAASAVGTVEFRSICEPIRNANECADFLEATATAIDTKAKLVSCRSVKCVGTACDIAEFELPYDYLVVAVGATSNTFGIKGVRENCIFLKQIEDAENLRTAISYCFERANVPNLSEQERRDALSFVIVGAGPTGVEFTSELRDFIECEGKKYFAKLLRYVRVRLIEAGDAVLPVFDKALQVEALSKITSRKTTLIEEGLIEREMTEVLLKAGVKEITDKCVVLSSGVEIPYGFCVWAAGNGPVPVVLDAIETIPAQKELQDKARGRLVTDSWLRVLGTDGVLSIGDCAFSAETPLPATAQVASQQGSYLGRLFSKGYNMRANPVPYKDSKASPADSGSGDVPPSERMSLGELGVRRDSSINNSNSSSSSSQVDGGATFAKPFQFLNLGILAYIGASEALAQVSVDQRQILGTGPIGFLLWRGIYWSKQVSWRNRLLVGIDWLKARLFGRDIGSI